MDEDRNTTGIYGDHREAPYDMTRESRLQLLTKMTLTDNTRNTVKEDLVLETIENFRAQYVALYPTRAPLLLSPQNEYSCRKFISTFIRPTQLKYDELYDWFTLSKFVANYIRYEELQEPSTLPSIITSPTTVMQWQIGNCIEMAILLASLLIGDGYNAYVCVGYAKKAVCANDQTANPWPDALPEEVNPDDIVIPKPKPTSEYMAHLKLRPKLVSKFDEYEREQRILDDFANNDMFADEAPNDTEENKLIHAWVLVLNDRRKLLEPRGNINARLHLRTTVPFLGIPSTSVCHESQLPTKGGGGGGGGGNPLNATKSGAAADPTKAMGDAIFIEPSTGQWCKPSEAATKYEGIESIFNKENYFVNMNPSSPVDKLSLDLRDLTSWERVFLSDPNIQSVDEDGEKRNKSGPGGLGEPTSVVGEGGDQSLDLLLTWVAPITLNLAQYANRYPGRQKTIIYAGVTVELFAEYSEPDQKVLVVTVDDDSKHKEMHTFYKFRADRMRRKSLYPLTNGKGLLKTHFWFEPGRMHDASHRVEGLRELIVEPGIQRTMRFYWKSRDDGLAQRIERFSENNKNIPIKVKEFYKGRVEDYLVYRSAKYDLPREGGGGLGVATLPSKDHRSDPIKMSEKFARNPNIPIDKDVEKRIYTKPQSNEGEIWVKYHYRPNCITRGIRLYPKNFDREKDLTAAAMIAKDQGRDNALDVQPYVVLMPDMVKPKDTDLLNELRVLVDKETECLNEIRAKADDCKDILAQLNLEREDQKGSHGGDRKDKGQRDNAIISIFDTLRGRTKETEAEIAQRKAEEQRRAESRKDYLAPFIAKQENMAKICKGDYSNAKLSLEMARKVRDEAIADLKERLIERGHIMQSRLDKEREDLMRRQMAFQKAIDGSDGAKESDEFSRFGKDATWRIRILEERLSNYIKSSADKYRQLADRFANDKRLAALYTSGGENGGK